MANIHKPRLIVSNVPYGSGNKITQEVTSATTTISTEYWTSEPAREFMDAGVVTAKKGYTWITTWELGKNYISTKIFDENNNLVGIYCDITSPVEKPDGYYQAYDWYLDVFKVPDGETHILDEDELEAALQAGFLTQSEAKIARNSAQSILRDMLNQTIIIY